jgi:hypothetical protein
LTFPQQNNISFSQINHSLIIFSFLATFHSFVNARYSDISIDCNDFDADRIIVDHYIAI